MCSVRKAAAFLGASTTALPRSKRAVCTFDSSIPSPVFLSAFDVLVPSLRSNSPCLPLAVRHSGGVPVGRNHKLSQTPCGLPQTGRAHAPGRGTCSSASGVAQSDISPMAALCLSSPLSLISSRLSQLFSAMHRSSLRNGLGSQEAPATANRRASKLLRRSRTRGG
jgi:hypothetical protein